MDDDRIDQIIKRVDNLPTLPSVATRLLHLTSQDSAAGAQEVSRIVESDQALTARVLRLANSSLYSTGRPIATVAEAIVVMGFDALRNNVLSIKVFDLFGSDGDSGANRRAFWKHALGVGCCAELLAERLGGHDRDEAFVAGLLHDIGKVALDYCYPAEFARSLLLVQERGMPSVVAEQREIGADHVLVGKRLAEQWNLPASVAESIWRHHQALGALGEAGGVSGLVRLVHASDVICGQQHIGLDEGRPTFLSDADLVTHLGLTPDALAEVTRVLRQRIEMRARVLGVDEADEVTLFIDAIQSANGQLGRVNERLEGVNRRLARRLKAFAALNDMNTRILPASDLDDALRVVARTVQRCFEADHVICYVHDDQQRTVSIASLGAAPESARLLHVPAPEGALDVPSTQWVIGQAEQRFDTGRVYSMPLSADGRGIGGVVIHVGRGDLNGGTAADQVVFSAILSAAAVALAKARLRERLLRETERLVRANRDLEGTYAELLETQKLKAVATMAAGAAHEINNPLAVISGRAQFLKSREADVKKQEELDLITEQSTRISRIINELMAYARPAEPALRSADLNDLAEAVVTEVAPSLSDRNIAVTSRPADSPPRVHTDPDQVRSLVAGLALALADALEAGAGLRISTHAPGLADSAELRVASVNAALPREALPSIFEPFFSLSLHGHGFGLAFAKCQSGVKKLGGDIWVDNESDRATRFRILLPLAG